MSRTRRFPYELWNALGATVTLFVFLTGVSSLPRLLRFLGRPLAVDGAAAPQGVLAGVPTELQVAFSLLSLPLFCLINAWFLAGVARAVMASLDRMQIQAAIPEGRFVLFLLLPVATGLDMLIVSLLFGTYFRGWPALLGLACLLVTGLLLYRPDVWRESLRGLLGREGAGR